MRDHYKRLGPTTIDQTLSVVLAALALLGLVISGPDIATGLPGEITAQATEDVYDTPTGRYLLIPQGARLIGTYDSSIAFGQNQMLLVWTRLIMPNGISIVLERLPGAMATPDRPTDASSCRSSTCSLWLSVDRRTFKAPAVRRRFPC